MASKSDMSKIAPETADTLAMLRKLCSHFYWLCFYNKVGSTAHAFIEFNGLMSKYVDLLTLAAEKGIDPSDVNEHTGVALPIEEHDMRYLGEKLRCIFGPIIDSNPAARAAFAKALGFKP